MWTETPEGQQYIETIAKQIVTETAPEELELFPELVGDYFSDPHPPATLQRESDDALGFGIGETLVAVTPAAAAMVAAVLNYLLNEAVKAALNESAEAIKKKIKALFNPKSRADNAVEPLSKEQLEMVYKIAVKEATIWGTERDEAKKMATAMVGALALAS
jgi:hypothetical protein